MNRRNFLTSMLAACAAPAIVRADSLMRIVPRDTMIIGYDLAGEDYTTIIYGGRRLQHTLYSRQLNRFWDDEYKVQSSGIVVLSA